MIAITGGIASGKSTVSERLRSLGALVLDADVYSRQVVEPFTEGWKQVREAFPSVIKADLTIDRRLLAEIVFSDQARRQILEEIIHPRVFEKLREEGLQAKKDGKIVFAEIPLLYEVGWDQWMEEVWVVYVSPQVQLQRLMKRAQITLEQAEQMINCQLPLSKKVQMATQVINNDGSLEETWEQVDNLWKKLQHDKVSN